MNGAAQTVREVLERKNAANLLQKLHKGGKLTPEEMEQVVAFQEKNGRATLEKKLNFRQKAFADMVIKGSSMVDAYRLIYKPKFTDNKKVGTYASRIGSNMAIREYIAMFQQKSQAKTLLSHDERLAILARDAQLPGDTPQMIHARARVLEVYTKIAGDGSPETVNVNHSTTPGAPIQVAVVPMTKAQKVAAMRAGRAARRPATAPAGG